MKWKQSPVMMTFDRYLVLKIISHLNYKNVIRCRRVSKFFESQITVPKHNDNDNDNELFWASYLANRLNHKITKIIYTYLDYSDGWDMATFSHPDIDQDLYDIRDHLLWRFRNNATIVSIRFNEVEIHKASPLIP